MNPVTAAAFAAAPAGAAMAATPLKARQHASIPLPAALRIVMTGPYLSVN